MSFGGFLFFLNFFRQRGTPWKISKMVDILKYVGLVLVVKDMNSKALISLDHPCVL